MKPAASSPPCFSGMRGYLTLNRRACELLISKLSLQEVLLGNRLNETSEPTLVDAEQYVMIVDMLEQLERLLPYVRPNVSITS